MLSYLKKICFFCIISFVFPLCSQKTIYIVTCCTGERPLDPIAPIFNMERIVKPLQDLCKACSKLGYTLKSGDLSDSLHDVDYFLCFDIPWNKVELLNLFKYPKEKRIVFLWEPPTVKPFNYVKKHHSVFDKIFTWSDDLVDNESYFKFHYPYPCLHMIDYRLDFDKKKLCTLIVSNKCSDHPDELYSARKAVIDFFERHDAGDFYFYGKGWSAEQFALYGGSPSNKIALLRQYKFCICYENMKNSRGYITEKIFDCFVAGCVPIYLGAPNIEWYIPKECFIDRNDFESDTALYHFLKSVTKEDYQIYIDHIQRYLASSRALLFSTEYFIDTVLRNIIPEYDRSFLFTEKQIKKLSELENLIMS